MGLAGIGWIGFSWPENDYILSIDPKIEKQQGEIAWSFAIYQHEFIGLVQET